MRKRALCLLLALVILAGCIPAVSIPAQAAGNGVAQKISQLRSKFPNGWYWNHRVDNWSQTGDNLLKNWDNSFGNSVSQTACWTHNGVPNPGEGKYDCNHFDGGIQCWGFANKIFYDIFGVYRSSVPKRYDKENITVGDYVRFGSDGDGHSAVVINRVGDTLTLVEGNFQYNCMIKWDRQVNLYSGDYGRPIAYFCHAPNYDAINGSSPAPQPSTLTLDKPTLIYADNNNAQIESYIRNGGSPVYCSKFGMKVWEKATGKLIVDHKEDISSNVQGGKHLQIWVNLTRELNITLKSGTEYEYQFFAYTGSSTISSEKSTFKTTGPTPEPVTIKINPGEGGGAEKTVTIAAGESYTLDRSSYNFSAPYGMVFGGWMMKKGLLPTPLLNDKVTTSDSDAGKTITVTALWKDDGTYKIRVVKGTEKVVKVTSTNAILTCDLKTFNADKENKYFKTHYASLVKINPDGTKTHNSLKGIYYTPEQLSDGVHTLTLDLSQERILSGDKPVILEPGTKYQYYMYVGGAGNGTFGALYEFTTLKEDEEPSPSPSSSPAPWELSITGVEVQDGVYNGSAQKGYSGTPKAAGYSGTIAVKYTGRGTTSYESTTAPKNAGTYTVTFTADDGKAYGELSLNFTIIKASVTITAERKNVPVGGSMPKLTYTVTGLAGGDKLAVEPTLACTDTPDLNVVATHVIKASGAKVPATGNYNDRITYIDGILNVYAGDDPGDGPTGLRLDQSELYLTPGKSAVLKPIVEPAGAVVDHYIWQSDDPRVARVSSDGTVTAVKEGRIAVRASTSDGAFTADCVVIVGPWYQKAVDYVQKTGLMSGYGDGSFGASDRLSRAQLAQVLYNREKRPAFSGTSKFSDVKKGAWYANAVNWAAGKGLITGSKGKFNPDNDISRQDLAVILWRYAGSQTVVQSLVYSDAYQISDYAKDAMRWAVKNGVISGSGGKLNPRGYASRSEVAQMLMNYFSKQ